MDDTFSPVVAADVFEEGSGVPATLRRLGALVVVEPLSAGDYRISGGALIERKTVADLHGSLGRRRVVRTSDAVTSSVASAGESIVDKGGCAPPPARS